MKIEDIQANSIDVAINSMSRFDQENFSELVSQFLAQWCEDGADLHVTELALFAKFRVFWAQSTRHWIHEASYQEFHTEMLRQGYRFARTPRRTWFGLKLRKKPKEM